jgi:hypothetical protein
MEGYIEGVPHLEYHYYHSKCQPHIDYAVRHPDAAIVLKPSSAPSG